MPQQQPNSREGKKTQKQVRVLNEFFEKLEIDENSCVQVGKLLDAIQANPGILKSINKEMMKLSDQGLTGYNTDLFNVFSIISEYIDTKQALAFHMCEGRICTQEQREQWRSVIETLNKASDRAIYFLRDRNLTYMIDLAQNLKAI